jgi:hypothetical protein
MSAAHDGFSTDGSYNIDLLLESARDIVGKVKDLSRSVETKLDQSASLDEIIPLLTEKRDRVNVLSRLSREISLLIRGGEDGAPAVPLPDSAREQFLDLVSEFQELMKDHTRLEERVSMRGLRLSGRKR